MTAPFALIHTADQWLRCAHLDTALDMAPDTDGGVVSLAWKNQDELDGTAGGNGTPAALAFDPWCRLYLSRPEAGGVDTLLWSERRNAERARPLFAEPAAAPAEPGAFRPADPAGGALNGPTGLVVDETGRLFVAETGTRRLLAFDLMDRRLFAIHRLDGRPTALATDGRRVVALVFAEDGGARLLELSGAAPPRPVPLPDGIADPGAIAIVSDGVVVLDRPGTENARLVPLWAPAAAVELPFATALAAAADDVHAARGPGDRIVGRRFSRGAVMELPPLDAIGYQGGGIAIDPRGEVVFWTANGLAAATRARLQRPRSGRIVSFRLDSGAFQTRWGRIFLDACIPEGTRLEVRCITADEPPEGLRVPLTAPSNLGQATVDRPDLSPLPPAALVPAPDAEIAPPAARAAQRLHPRATGSERPWTCPDDRFVTYEAPVIAPPGRYLWLVLEMTGGGRSTPMVRSVRVEHPARDLLRRLPRIFSAEPPAADFLHRYLTMAESDMGELDELARLRNVLLMPRATPPGMLAWLGSLLGLEIDDRWSERATREILENAIWLFRRRGTVVGLKRFIEIYLDREVVLVEHFKLRGLGGAFLGEAAAETANSVLGAGFRIGGRIGEERLAEEAEPVLQDAIAAHAHRFTVLVPALLDSVQRDVIGRILDVHRPAHTVVDVCSVDSGMRAGVGLHLDLSSLVGATSGWGVLRVGGSALGRRDVVGRPGMADALGAARIGGEARVG